MKKCDCKGYKSCLCNKELTIFKDLTEEEFNKLATGMTCFHFNKGEYICYEGEKLSKLFLISKGSVKTSKLTKGGKEQIMHIFSVVIILERQASLIMREEFPLMLLL